MTPEELAEIRAREQAATPGPWRTHDTYVPDGGYCMAVFSDDANHVGPRAWLPTFSTDTGSPMARNVEADAEFMAGAREDIPALLKHVAALEAEREQLREVLWRKTDDEPCDVDHNGYCQAHNLSFTPCATAEARRLLGDWEPADDAG